MNFHFIAQRYWLNLKRHKLTFFVSFPLFGVMMAIIGSVYSKNLIKTLLDVPTFQALIGHIHIDNPGMLVWFLFYTSIFVLIFPAVGIFYGIRMIPFNERDGKELIFSTKMSPIVYFIENFIIVMILIPLTTFSVFLVSVLFLRTQMPLNDAVNYMLIANIFPVFFVMVVAMVTVFGASLRSSSRVGLAFGGLFYLICFALNLIVEEIGSISLDIGNIHQALNIGDIHVLTLNIGNIHILSLRDLSLMTQINLFQNVLGPTINTSHFTITQLNTVINYNSYLLTCTILIIILFLLTILSLYRVDYIEPRTDFKQNLKNFLYSYRVIGIGFVRVLKITRLYVPAVYLKRAIVHIYKLITRPIQAFMSSISKKYPAFSDQLKASFGFFIIYTIATTFLVIIVLLAYPGDQAMNALFTNMSSIIDNPLIAGFMFGHPVSAANNANLEGFILFKLFTFHWLYYGPFLFIATYYILMRDKSNKYDEINWSLPKTRSSVLISRTAAMIIYFWITVFINWLGIPIGYVMLKTYMDVSPPNAVNTFITFFFLAMGYSLFLVLFLAIALIVNSKYIIISLSSLFIFAIFIPMIGDVSNATWIDYLSPFKWFDVVGLMLQDINIIGTVIPTLLIGSIIVLGLYYYSIKVITPKKDIT